MPTGVAKENTRNRKGGAAMILLPKEKIVSEEQKFAGVLVAWAAVLDEEKYLVGFQFLEPGVPCSLPQPHKACTLIRADEYETDTEVMYMCQWEPWADEVVQHEVEHCFATFDPTTKSHLG
jgi:hypothetical protein